MKWLIVGDTIYSWLTDVVAPSFSNYPLPDEGESLYWRWVMLSYPDDKTISGVFADWLEDNRQTLLTGAVGEKLEQRLDDLIANLRRRFFSFADSAGDIR